MNSYSTLWKFTSLKITGHEDYRRKNIAGNFWAWGLGDMLPFNKEMI